MKRYRKRFLAGICLTAAAAGIGGTLAYFTDTETKVNTFTMGDLEIGLEEPEWEEEKGDGSEMYPGYTVYKNPTVKNTTSGQDGDSPCYLRMRVEIQDESGDLITDEKALALIQETIYYDRTYSGSYGQTGAASGLIEGRVPGYSLLELSGYPMVNPIFEKDEARSQSGVLIFNYNGPEGDGILSTGEEAVLFTNIVIPTDWTQEQIETAGNFRLDITAECIQIQSFESRENAWEVLDRETAEARDET